MLCNQLISEKVMSRLIDIKIVSDFSLSCACAKTNISTVLFRLLTLKFIISFFFQKGLMNLPRLTLRQWRIKGRSAAVGLGTWEMRWGAAATIFSKRIKSRGPIYF